jgi:hypothetical protein
MTAVFLNHLSTTILNNLDTKFGTNQARKAKSEHYREGEKLIKLKREREKNLHNLSQCS